MEDIPPPVPFTPAKAFTRPLPVEAKCFLRPGEVVYLRCEYVGQARFVSERGRSEVQCGDATHYVETSELMTRDAILQDDK